MHNPCIRKERGGLHPSRRSEKLRRPCVSSLRRFFPGSSTKSLTRNTEGHTDRFRERTLPFAEGSSTTPLGPGQASAIQLFRDQLIQQRRIGLSFRNFH